MTTNLIDFPLQAWKQQLDAALQAFETYTEASLRVREAQLEAAVEAHAAAEAVRKQVADAQDLQALWRIQGEFLASNMAKSLAYWRSLYEALALAPAPQVGQNLVQTMDSAYKRWLETTQQFYAAPMALAAAAPK
ncbi:MAG: phasin family protein [Clostridia bacterium]